MDKYELGEQSNYIYGQSSIKLWNVFDENGGKKTVERFFKKYYETYRYKEVDTKEFVAFLKHYLDLKDDQLFEDWLELGKEETAKR